MSKIEFKDLSNGDKAWYKDGLAHREDGPAFITYNGCEYWYQNGKLHRENDPAIITFEGIKQWWNNGARHREDGPAVEYADGTKVWYLNNIKYTEQEFKEIIMEQEKKELDKFKNLIKKYKIKVGDKTSSKLTKEFIYDFGELKKSEISCSYITTNHNSHYKKKEKVDTWDIIDNKIIKQAGLKSDIFKTWITAIDKQNKQNKKIELLLNNKKVLEVNSKNITYILEDSSEKGEEIIMNKINDKLDFYAKNNFNVLLKGYHGTGKTSLILDTFKKHGLNYIYFSASTLDPWVDLIGIPKDTKQKIDNVNYEFIHLIPPERFSKGNQIDALFFDELNRAPKKVKNAVMELIQFKTINGNPIPGLKFVWGAINPDDEESSYDTEKLDPALLDRFHAVIEVENKPDKEYFDNKYGAVISNIALNWWSDTYNILIKNKQKSMEENFISPRRLDYALEIHSKGGSLVDVLPMWSNPVSLEFELRNTNIENYINNILSASSDVIKKSLIEKTVNNPVMVTPFLKYLFDHEDAFQKLINYMKIEFLISIKENEDYAERFNKILDARENLTIKNIINSIEN